ncbi:MAG TPA: DUF2721 domain-containing protein [Burkholderiales bacterium]|nr:DUF2721 domain-containing protein [Burkholderiales bacterium]
MPNMPFTAASSLGDIAHIIQLAIAPVFLLTAVGTLLAVLTNRLGRAVDRRRVLASRLAELDAAVAALAAGELEYIERRVKLIYAAISLAVLCALLVCLLIALAFIDAFVAFNFSKGIAALFVLAMLALVGSLSVFLREIFLGVTTVVCPIR